MRPILAMLILTACAMPPGGPAQAPDCGAAALQGLRGQEASALPASGALRLIRPGDAVTEDYAPSRLNVALDDQGRIETLTCG